MHFEIFLEILRSSSPILANNGTFQPCIILEWKENNFWQILKTLLCGEIALNFSKLDISGSKNKLGCISSSDWPI